MALCVKWNLYFTYGARVFATMSFHVPSELPQLFTPQIEHRSALKAFSTSVECELIFILVNTKKINI